MSAHCPGYAAEPFATLCNEAPGVDVYPADRFRFEWGPIFHRGRLDGTARILIVGQDPATHEAVTRRILVGTAGRRVQGFLAKLGIALEYTMLNAFLYSVYGNQDLGAAAAEETLAAYRNRWIDAVLDASRVEAVVAFGNVAKTAIDQYAATVRGRNRSLLYEHLLHPTYPESSGGGDSDKVATATARMLAQWQEAVERLRPLLSPTLPPTEPYGEAFRNQDIADIPPEDLPAGLPEWMRSGAAWAFREGATPAQKRATLVVRVPAETNQKARPSPAARGALSQTRRPCGDAFEDAYDDGILDADPMTEERKALRMAPPPSRSWILRGAVLLCDRVVDPGYVLIRGTVVEEVGSGDGPPADAAIDTKGVIVPGLIDLHGHPEYNVFSAWEPPHLYQDRFQWRQSDAYRVVIKEPWALLEAGRDAMCRYAEIRALTGGVTAIQGASPRYPTEEALVRNVDKRIFERHAARSAVDIGRITDPAKLASDIATGTVTAFYAHVAEGVTAAARHEYDDLKAAGLLTSATILIHAVGLGDTELNEVAQVGAKLVWSPQSNLRLYGQTTQAARAIELGIPLALGADWLPSGSASLLAEIQVARRVLAQQGRDLGAKALVDMVTWQAADIAGLGDKLGRIECGRPADVVVFERWCADPWEAVASAEPARVELVVINGDLTYGRPVWVETLTGSPCASLESVIAWGKPMWLDTSLVLGAQHGTPPKLSELRTMLTASYPHIGPIFA